jgi:DNA-binding transcriptional ArsR family regulator
MIDPLALRALAHPLRLKLYSLVGREGLITAAEAARQLSVSQALASHHLRHLAKHDLIEAGPAGDNRERPWRVTATSLDFPEAEEPDEWESVDLLERYLVDQAAAQLADWQQRRWDAEPQWREKTGATQSLLYLTAAEMAELVQAWQALITPLANRRPLGAADQRPADALPVNITLVAVPLPPTASGG